MQKHEEWLCERLPEWEAEGLLQHEAVEKLRKRYSAKPSAAKPLGASIVSAFGALMVGLGVIALFAANWYAMSRGTRAFVSLLPLTVCSVLAFVAFYREWRAKAFWEALGVLWSLAIWSGFGLVCQTYHLSDDVHAFVFACTLLCLPILYFTKSVGAIIAYPIYIIVWQTTAQHDYSPWRAVGFILLMAIYLPIVYLRWKEMRWTWLYEFGTTKLVALATLFALLMVCEHWFRRSANAYLFFSLSLWIGAACWILSEYTHWKPQRLIAIMYALPMLFAVPINSGKFMRYYSDHDYSEYFVLWAVLLIPLFIAGFYLIRNKNIGKEKTVQVAVAMFSSLLAALTTLLCLPTIIMYLYILALAAVALWHALAKLKLLQLNLALCVLLYEILVKYLSSDWSFTAKGIIMLLAGGIALLATNLFVIRKRKGAEAQEVAK